MRHRSDVDDPQADQDGSDDSRPHRNATRGEPRNPEDSASQSSEQPDREPHSALNTPVSEIEGQDEIERLGRRDSVSDVKGMGSPETSETRGSGGDPVERGGGDDRETRNPAQATPRGIRDAEQEAMVRAEERTGVRLTE